MSDSQVLEYVKDGIRQGKEQKQLASELARRGVTKEQATRVKQLYEQQNNVNASNATGTDVNESRLREEMKENTSDMLEDHPSTHSCPHWRPSSGQGCHRPPPCRASRRTGSP